MLIDKKPTEYGYAARLRFDVKLPTVHVIQKGSGLRIYGVADLTVITGDVTVIRKEQTIHVKDKLTDKDSYRVPPDKYVMITANQKTVLLEDNSTNDRISEYLDLTVVEDEPSSDDLQYIDDE